MIIQINFKPILKGFGYFLIGSAKKGKAQVVLDIESFLNICIENKEVKFKEIFTETVLHEILHVVEELFDKSFSHKRINTAIKKLQKEINEPTKQRNTKSKQRKNKQ